VEGDSFVACRGRTRDRGGESAPPVNVKWDNPDWHNCHTERGRLEGFFRLSGVSTRNAATSRLFPYGIRCMEKTVAQDLSEHLQIEEREEAL